MARKNKRWSETDYQNLLKKSPRLQKQVFGSGNQVKEIIPVTHTPVEDLLESEIQELFFKFVDTPENQHLYQGLDCVFAIPNAGKRGAMAISEHLKTGLKSGIPDVQVCVSRKPFFNLFIEFKTWRAFKTKNHGCSENQLIWIERLRNQGNKVLILWNYLEAIEEVKNYLGKKII